jgi:hypothetical protein
LSEPWNLDDPIEDLWAKIANIQRVATFGNVPIADITIITLTLAMIEKTGLLATTTEKFRLRPILEWTVALFKSELQLGNKERLRRLTAGDAGFHGAHTAIRTPTLTVGSPPLAVAAATAITPSPTTPPAARHVTVEGGKMYYCWTHGLSRHSNHTSLTCLHKAAGHQDDATAFHMRGGNSNTCCAPCSITDTSTSKFGGACTASHKQDALPTTSSSPFSSLTDTHLAR